MEKYEKREAHPLEKYIGRLAKLGDDEFEVVGYSCKDLDGEGFLIVDASQSGGWSERELESFDFVSKECKYYWYVNIIDLID